MEDQAKPILVIKIRNTVFLSKRNRPLSGHKPRLDKKKRFGPLDIHTIHIALDSKSSKR